jgi:hypothetical protein
MVSKQDLYDAKQTLSARLLRKGFKAGVLGFRATNVIGTLVDRAGQNVHALGIGYKTVEGRVTKKLCVQIFVTDKLPKALLRLRQLIPPELDGIPTDVIASPPAFLLTGTKKSATRKAAKSGRAATTRAADDRASLQGASGASAAPRLRRPVTPGISAGHHLVTAGTIACFCRSRDGTDPSVFALSNNHVFANVNSGVAGDDLFQPGNIDGGTSAHRFAELTRFVRLKVDKLSPNHVDAAVGRLLNGISFNPEIPGVGRVKGSEVATVNLEVRKLGRTTGLTEGVVTSVLYDPLVGMSPNNPDRAALFEDQILIRPRQIDGVFGLGGDSGSLVVAKVSNRAVGLYFAGPESGVYGIANHISEVLDELGLDIT